MEVYRLGLSDFDAKTVICKVHTGWQRRVDIGMPTETVGYMGEIRLSWFDYVD